MKSWLSIASCLLAIGCVSTSVQRLDQEVRPARSPDSVALLDARPDTPHTVIAVIQSNGESIFDSFDDLREEMIAEAAKLGGDALVLGAESTDTDFILTGTAMIKSDTKQLRGEVIVFKRER